ncbi:hypothetical protein ABZV93_04505 [Actinopolymorpha sp. NPDC004070]|uniref:hypothetical protein n=1 Tax=Actinopolymorpha sp. NPDC004070 TaxID=3154548 RepID=UPI0033ADFC1E
MADGFSGDLEGLFHQVAGQHTGADELTEGEGGLVESRVVGVRRGVEDALDLAAQCRNGVAAGVVLAQLGQQAPGGH